MLPLKKKRSSYAVFEEGETVKNRPKPLHILFLTPLVLLVPPFAPSFDLQIVQLLYVSYNCIVQLYRTAVSYKNDEPRVEHNNRSGYSILAPAHSSRLKTTKHQHINTSLESNTNKQRIGGSYLELQQYTALLLNNDTTIGYNIKNVTAVRVLFACSHSSSYINICHAHMLMFMPCAQAYMHALTCNV